jgi:hypothetical protein
MPADKEGWYEEKGIGARAAKKAAIILIFIAVACIPIAVWALAMSGGMLIFMFAYLIGVLAGGNGLVLHRFSRNGRIFRRRLGYWCMGNPRQFKAVNDFMRGFLAGKYIEYETKDMRRMLEIVSASGTFRGFLVKSDTASMKTRFFGFSDTDGMHDELLSEFRALAIRVLGLNEGNLEL